MVLVGAPGEVVPGGREPLVVAEAAVVATTEVGVVVGTTTAGAATSPVPVRRRYGAHGDGGRATPTAISAAPRDSPRHARG